MVGKKLKSFGRILLFDNLEELRHSIRIIPGVVEHVGADRIGLRFGGPGIVEQHGVQAKTNPHLAQLAHNT